MASGRARCTRKLRNWVVEQVESGQFPGVCWDDTAKTMFRIPWKHAGKQDFREDQDAAFFKAWAIFKGKYKEGDTGGPAVWKTRLRCALNKSSEFKEVPERGRMDVAEPYKVYQLLPPGIVSGQPGTQKVPSKRQHSSVSSERKEEEDAMQNCTLSPSVLQDSLNNEEEGASGGAVHSDIGSSSSSSSPEPQEVTDTTEAPFQGDQRSLEFLLPPEPGSTWARPASAAQQRVRGALQNRLLLQRLGQVLSGPGPPTEVPGNTEFLGREPWLQPYSTESYHSEDGAGLCPILAGADSRAAGSHSVPGVEPGGPIFHLTSLFFLSPLK
ncbi:interferon regulatory factor 9 isoform 4 [Homo sapiens]|uniref:Interferon regulatory factor 9 n=1 Tax=Homo sapiens TaxID=9606 RepID=A0A8V8TP83_HUMAN|nr:interferon regulatory factor 9 isoform 4 [Homo sapiens]